MSIIKTAVRKNVRRACAFQRNENVVSTYYEGKFLKVEIV